MAEQHSQTSDYQNRWKFKGHELDRETGLYYAGARYYDPRVSIWLSVDPLVEKTFEPYNYVGNNPIRYIGPTGMNKEDGGDPPKRKNFVVVDGSKPKEKGLKNNGNEKLEVDKALESNLEAIKKLDPDVSIIHAKSKDDMLNQIKSNLGDGEIIGNLTITGHGGYNNTGTYIGKSYIGSKGQFKSLGKSLSSIVDKDSNIAFTACHIGAGNTPELSKAKLQAFSDSSGAQIYGNMTWGAASSQRFNNRDGFNFFINYSNFFSTPSSYSPKDGDRTNSINNLGNYLFLKPKSDAEVIRNVYFTRSGNIKNK